MKEKYSFLKLAEDVIRECGKPMNPNDIWKVACQNGYDRKMSTIGKTPQYTISGALSRNVKLENSIFICTCNEPKLYGLKEFESEVDVPNDNNVPNLFDDLATSVGTADLSTNINSQELIEHILASLDINTLTDVWRYLGFSIPGFRVGSKTISPSKIINGIQTEIASLLSLRSGMTNVRKLNNKKIKITNDLVTCNNIDDYKKIKQKSNVMFYVQVVYDAMKNCNLPILDSLFSSAVKMTETMENSVNTDSSTSEFKAQLKEANEKLKRAEKEKANLEKVNAKLKNDSLKISNENEKLRSEIAKLKKDIKNVKDDNYLLNKNYNELSGKSKLVEEDIFRFKRLSMFRRILLVDMIVKETNSSSDWITITMKDIYNNNFPKFEISDLWLIKGIYSPLKKTVIIDKVVANYGYVNVFEIDKNDLEKVCINEV